MRDTDCTSYTRFSIRLRCSITINMASGSRVSVLPGGLIWMVGRAKYMYILPIFTLIFIEDVGYGVGY